MELTVEKVIKSRRKRDIEKIYTKAFPKEERMPFFLMLLMSCLWHTEFLAFYDGEKLCGLIYMASIRKAVFIMFFAVAEELRSQGYGSRILDTIQSIYPGQKIIVSIEPCRGDVRDIGQRIRRKNFYRKNGYTETGYFMKMAGQEQEILIKNGSFERRAFILFFMLYSNFTVIPKIWKEPL